MDNVNQIFSKISYQKVEELGLEPRLEAPIANANASVQPI